MDIISPGTAGPELTRGINRLVTQLTGKQGHVNAAHVQDIIAAENSQLLVAVEQGSVLGMLTLIHYAIPTGIRAVIEDMVVDRTARGKGVGRALLERAVSRARAMGADNICLTSNPSRKSANRLYRSAGFVRRQTNAYRYPLSRTRG